MAFAGFDFPLCQRTVGIAEGKDVCAGQLHQPLFGVCQFLFHNIIRTTGQNGMRDGVRLDGDQRMTAYCPELVHSHGRPPQSVALLVAFQLSVKLCVWQFLEVLHLSVANLLGNILPPEIAANERFRGDEDADRHIADDTSPSSPHPQGSGCGSIMNGLFLFSSSFSLLFDAVINGISICIGQVS